MDLLSKQQVSFNYMREYCREAHSLLEDLDMTSERRWIESDEQDAFAHLRNQCGAFPAHLRGARCSVCSIAFVPEMPKQFDDLQARARTMRESHAAVIEGLRQQMAELRELLLTAEGDGDADLQEDVQFEISNVEGVIARIERGWRQQQEDELQMLRDYKRLRYEHMQFCWAVERREDLFRGETTLMCQACAGTRLLQRADSGVAYYRRAVFEYDRHMQLQTKHIA